MILLLHNGWTRLFWRDQNKPANRGWRVQTLDKSGVLC